LSTIFELTIFPNKNTVRQQELASLQSPEERWGVYLLERFFAGKMALRSFLGIDSSFV